MSNDKYCEKIDFSEFDNELECLINTFLQRVKKNNKKKQQQEDNISNEKKNNAKKVIKKLDMNKIREAIKKATEVAKESKKNK